MLDRRVAAVPPPLDAELLDPEPQRAGVHVEKLSSAAAASDLPIHLPPPPEQRRA